MLSHESTRLSIVLREILANHFTEYGYDDKKGLRKREGERRDETRKTDRRAKD